MTRVRRRRSKSEVGVSRGISPTVEGAVTADGVYKMVKLYAERVGVNIEGFGAHSLRATAATNALDHEADIAKGQEWYPDRSTPQATASFSGATNNIVEEYASEQREVEHPKLREASADDKCCFRIVDVNRTVVYEVPKSVQALFMRHERKALDKEMIGAKYEGYERPQHGSPARRLRDRFL
jgi:hypothetical protein